MTEHEIVYKNKSLGLKILIWISVDFTVGLTGNIYSQNKQRLTGNWQRDRSIYYKIFRPACNFAQLKTVMI